MNETEAAEAVASGELPSGTRFGDCALVSLRITGTGIALRGTGEKVFRPPSVWLAQPTIDRVKSLPVILDHPPGSLLNEAEFAARSVGTIVFAYPADRGGTANAEGPDLWGVGRLFLDPQSVQDLAATGSTSPCVVFGADNDNETITLDDGTEVLRESNPQLLDHLALLSGGAAGVWDLGDPDQRGIRSDTLKEQNMDENDLAAADKAKADAEEARNADAPPAWAQAFMDACTKRFDALEALPKAQEETVDPIKEREREASLADVQARADAVAQAWGEKAPPPMSGESVIAYRKRCLNRHKQYSPQFKDVDIYNLANDPVAFSAVEQIIYADSEKASRNPEGPPDGTMLKRQRKTDSGHTITEWHGRETIFQLFSSPPMYCTAFLTPQNRGQ